MKFAPTIYEHLSTVSGERLRSLAYDDDKLVAAARKAVELYRADFFTLGLDVYNVEAEALGAELIWRREDCLPDVKGAVLTDLTDVERLRSLPFMKYGRTPLMISAARKLREALAPGIELRGAMTGPFSLAAILRGFDCFIFDLIEKEEVRELLEFTTEVCIAYGSAFIDAGVDLVLNESYISPPLLSPELYDEFVFPYHRKAICELKKRGAKVSLIAGGDTGLIVPKMVRTGTDLIMADADCDISLFRTFCEEAKVGLRCNVRSRDLETGDYATIKEGLKHNLEILTGFENIYVGAGIISQLTSIESVKRFRKIFDEFS